jgi:predicted fused transcriptional regulator/phosphomethylpyrimidine kinase
MAEFHAAVRREEDRGVVCRLHEEDAPELRGQGCDLCVSAARPPRLAEQEALDDVRRALEALEGAPGFAALIPSVGSNVARGKPGAQRTLDVAAVPGRIFEMRGAVRVPAPPEFGASRHVAEVVLAAMSVFPDLAGAINVRADEATLARARSLGWQAVEFEAAYEGRHERIAKALSGRRKAPRALFHRGAFGIEPVMYVLGRTAAEAASEAIALARAS